MLALFFALMAAVALGWLRLDWKWLSVAGALTYPLYLIHQYIGGRSSRSWPTCRIFRSGSA